MKSLSLYSAFAIIAIANASALIHAARNRSGTPTSELTLTNRELSYYASTASDDDSEVSLHLRWAYRNAWPDRDILRRLGFNCSVDPNGDQADRFYLRQRPRRAFIALEYDGPAWQALLEDHRREQAKMKFPSPGDENKQESHLVPIDADVNPASLRARHPDSSQVLIIPSVVSVNLTGIRSAEKSELQIAGSLESQSSIHVPLPFSGMFRRNFPQNRRNKSEAGYLVHLRYGGAYEPSIESVEFTP